MKKSNFVKPNSYLSLFITGIKYYFKNNSQTEPDKYVVI